MELRLTKIMNMVSTLQKLNESPNRDTDEVRNFVKDLLRVFYIKSTDTKKVKVPPRGYSGDVNGRTKTAYDSLSPKPWKPSS